MAAAKILVVDDNELNAEVLELRLAKLGYEVSKAFSGDQALELIAKSPPDVVLLDVTMPGLSGFDVIERLRKEEKTRTLPVILLTAMGDLDSKVKGLNCGADDYLSKPFEYQELLARLRAALRVKALQDERLRQNTELIRLNRELAEKNQQLADLIVQDDLTSLFNLRHFRRTIEAEHERARRFGRSYAILFIDLDRLREVNAAHGHWAGGRVLQAVGEVLHARIRKVDSAFRIGGDEFVVVSIETSKEQAAQFAEYLRRAVEETEIPEGGVKLKVTVSIGVASFPEDGADADEVLKRADEAVYQAKARGKNQVAVYGREQAPATPPDADKAAG